MADLRLYRSLVGMQWNCSPTNLSREDFMQKVFHARQDFLALRPNTLFCPKPAFTNRVVYLGQDDDVHARTVMTPIYGPGDPKDDPVDGACYDNSVVIGQEERTEIVMTRTKSPADGGIVFGEKNAVAFFNADCPIIALVEEDRMAVLHAGYRALIREDSKEPNILMTAMEHFNVSRTRAYIGYGIGPCCWLPEYADKPEISDPSKTRLGAILRMCLQKTTAKSPFGEGHLTVDLYALCKFMLRIAGIPENRILVNDRCTCCAEENGKPLFWSHNRFKAGRQATDGRNMAIAFLDSCLTNDGFEKL